MIFVILYLTYNDFIDAVLMMMAVPEALVGGVFFLWLTGHSYSVAVQVGFIACFGMATETGIIMLVYLRESIDRRGGIKNIKSLEELKQAVIEGAVHRLRPKLLTEGVAIVALAPMLWATGVGHEVISAMAAPVLGGLLVSDEVVDLFLPVRFYWVRRHRWLKEHGLTEEQVGGSPGRPPGIGRLSRTRMEDDSTSKSRRESFRRQGEVDCRWLRLEKPALRRNSLGLRLVADYSITGTGSIRREVPHLKSEDSKSLVTRRSRYLLHFPISWLGDRVALAVALPLAFIESRDERKQTRRSRQIGGTKPRPRQEIRRSVRCHEERRHRCEIRRQELARRPVARQEQHRSAAHREAARRVRRRAGTGAGGGGRRHRQQPVVQ